MAVFSKVKRVISKVYRVTNAKIFSRRSRFEVADSSDTTGMEPMAFYPPNVLEGDPKMRAKNLCSSGDGGLVTGLWDCTAGRFIWHFNCDEVVHIMEGEVTVEVNGKVAHLAKGNVAFFPIGTVSEWHVPQYVLKVFSHRNPTPTAKKLFE